MHSLLEMGAVWIVHVGRDYVFRVEELHALLLWGVVEGTYNTLSLGLVSSTLVIFIGAAGCLLSPHSRKWGMVMLQVQVVQVMHSMVVVHLELPLSRKQLM